MKKMTPWIFCNNERQEYAKEKGLDRNPAPFLNPISYEKLG
jgi:hypothetical protein